ncbi:phage minor tail protein L [Moraxella sp. ZY200743]|uniref:phage minor tail protein L n=1 Tax=Moraxella sp. ZY200743 TaxID=2911970 RepID=UPI003D7C94EF
MSFNADIQQSTVQGLITLYELDARRLGGDVYRFHGHNDGVITWQGQQFHPIAIKADGLEMRSDGRASTPKLTIGDNVNGVQGAVSALCRLYDDFAGAKLTVTHTLAEYLNSTDSQNYRQQEWYIEQKVSENPTSGIVEFELSNPVDLDGQKIPVRNITTFCHWAVCGRYRGEECGYTGTKRFTMDGKITDDPSLDVCGGTMPDCKLRDNEDSFGGFPASSLVS